MENDLLTREKELHDEGQHILDSLDLITRLSSFGKVEINGSFKTGLMTWPDIDTSSWCYR